MQRFFRSLRGQLAALIFVALLIPISVIGYYTVSLELAQKNLAANTELELKNAARELEPLFAELKESEQQEEIARLSAMVAGISRNYPGLRVSYFNGSLMYNFPTTYGLGAASKRVWPQAESLLVSIPQADRLADLQSIIARKPAGVEILNKEGANSGPPLIEARVLVGAGKQSLLILETRLGQFYLESRGPRQIIGGSLGLGLAIGVFGIIWISHRLQRRVNNIQAGLDQVTRDLHVPLAAQSGELGVVVDAINRMREELLSKRRLEEQLQRAERLAGLGQLVAGVAHEVRNPLGIMKGTVHLMEKDLQSEPALAKYKEHLQVLKEQVNRQNKVVEELLTYVRPVKPQFGPVSLPGVINSVLVFLGPSLRQQGIEYNIKMGNLPDVWGDGEKLKQVFVNLLLNAKDALPKGGKVKIEVIETGDGLQVDVSDNGSGISTECVKQVFDPFFSTKEAGTGLGLTIVKQLVELHGGSIGVESGPGGTTFKVFIPLRGESCAHDSGD